MYDKNGNRIAQLSDGEEIRTYQYDTQDRLLAVRDRKGLLQAALYNGDDDRVFLASRSERTGTVRLYEKKKEDQKAPDTSGLGDALAFFWYGFGLNMLETLTGGDTRTALVWDEVWDTLSYSVTRRTYMEQLEKEGILLYPEQEGEKPSDTMPAWKKPFPGAEGGVTFDGMDGVYIPYRQIEDTYAYFEVRSFVNDINRPYTEVLAAYDETGTARETYTYGLSRLSVETKAVTGEGRASHLSGQMLPSSHTGQDRKLYYGYTGRGSVAHLTDSTGAVFWQGDYDAFGLPVVDGGAVLSSTGGYTSGMADAGFIFGRQYDSGLYQPFGYNAEATDPASGLHYLRARYYDPQTGSFLSADGYPGSLDDPLSQNRYTYVQNDPVNHMDPSGHISLGRIWNSAKGALKKAGNFVVQGAKNAWNSGKKWVADAVSYTASKYQAAKAYFSNAFSGRGGSGTAKSAGAYSARSGGSTYPGSSRGGNYGGSSGGGGSGRYSGGGSSQPRSAYERAVQGGHSIFGWFQSKVKEARNIGRSWTKGLEKRFVHFCTTADHIRKDTVEFVKGIPQNETVLAGMFGLTISAKLGLEISKSQMPQLPEIDINYVGTWKDQLQLGIGIVTVVGGVALVVLGGVGTGASGGVAAPATVSLSSEGVAVALSGGTIVISALSKMFDVQIYKSESNGANEPENKGGHPEKREKIKSNLGREIDITPSEDHGVVSSNPGTRGKPNSSVDILDRQGNIVTRRWFDSEGKALRDVDMTQHRNTKKHPEYPHEHTWDWSKGRIYPKRIDE